MKKANKRSSAASVKSCTLAPVSKAPAIATATAAYGKQIVVTVSRQLPWTHNLIILGQSKRPEEREFYLCMAIKGRWGKRELERQFCQSFADKKIVSTMSTQR